ncbi:hypothetical protein H5410_036929 [Solanum commersonii]|uniref:Uncharacterized protein n=1 Tax=Solanum commersonii TaxID=4109 RepID=A0A9J5Y5N8_SOLCO|nr:hypothetical protein H5410_036929 [Solanum commersonii]
MIFGIHVDTRCTCCTISQLETLDQVFTTSDLARKVWNQIASPLGIVHNSDIVQGPLDYYLSLLQKNKVHKLLLHLIPCFTL